MTEWRCSDLTVVRDGITLVDGASFALSRGELVALLGPNGAGKTTLLRAALGLIERAHGTATLAGDDTVQLAAAERARRASYLPQQRPLAWPSPVRDIVALGRFARGVALGKLGASDHDAVTRALSACHLEELAHRPTDTLSGGELARVHCARAFAAEAPLVVADEPVAALDPRHQLSVMQLIRKFVDQGGGALIVIHDISLAARFADRLLWMHQGQIVADGPPAATLTEERLSAVYGVKASVEGRHVKIVDIA